MRLIKEILMAVLATCWVLGCTAMTDFDEPVDKVDVSAELSQNNIDVSLTGNTGVVQLQFSEDLPVEQQDEIFDLIGNEISISVTNTETNVGVEVTTQPSVGTPSAPGQYRVSVADDNRSVSVQFYNEALGGQTVQSGVSYAVIVTVLDNDYVETGVHSFQVTID